ncbi:MAG TPA: DUF58 domain-containing protein [Cytophagales bacterium]|jgi:uncharacterized protein (DUF58 family)|nr:DUF58 domain-containing protein [Cytophagales bacterium]
MKQLFINTRFYMAAAACIVLMVLGYIWPFILPVGQFLFLGLAALTVFDAYMLLKFKGGIGAVRECAERFSNGDVNDVIVKITNHYPSAVRAEILDEAPPEFQERNLRFMVELKSGGQKALRYQLKPVRRGKYHFGDINVLISTGLGLVSRKYSVEAGSEVKVYPSYLQLRKYELLAISNQLTELGIKKIRKLGHNMEFEHIKEYVEGDDYRTINWKATARHNHPMVNVYQDEKSQNVYAIIDKGRVMKMPFEQMSLLDYAINSALVISNVAVKKDDKAGLMTFEKRPETFLAASKRHDQMKRISEMLYKETTTFGESDFSRLFVRIEREIHQRSLLLLYTNFESLQSMERQLSYFKSIAARHVMVVIFFHNTELDDLTRSIPQSGQEVYNKVIAEKFAFEKRQIVRKLQQYGIYSILTTPQNLTIDVINKYLELKARHVI